MMPDIYKDNMNVLHLALAHQLRAPDLDMFRKFPLPSDVALGAGVVDVKDPTPDGVEAVVERIERILEVVDPHQVVLMPDCGWMNKLRHTALDKNAELVEAANIVRKRYQ
jgi:methionine synthase II (cobalamin-independent)